MGGSMKVYVVWSGKWEDADIDALFSTRELAEQHKMEVSSWPNGWTSISEFEVDNWVKRNECKTELIDMKGLVDAGRLPSGISPGMIDKLWTLVQPYEVNGWEAQMDDFCKHNNYTDGYGKCRVGFVRYVEQKEE
jgi:hypothetical protein